MTFLDVVTCLTCETVQWVLAMWWVHGTLLLVICFSGGCWWPQSAKSSGETMPFLADAAEKVSVITFYNSGLS